MSSVASDWLKPPVFSGDENKAGIAHTLHVICFLALVAVLIYAALLFGLNRYGIQNLAFVVPVLPLVIGLLHLLKRGFVHLSTLLFVFFAWLNLTVVIVSTPMGKMQAIILLAYILIVLAAGLLIGGRLAIIFTLLNMISGSFLIYLEDTGLLLNQGSAQNGIVIWITQAFFLLSVAILFNLVLKSLHDAIKRAILNESYHRARGGSGETARCVPRSCRAGDAASFHPRL